MVAPADRASSSNSCATGFEVEGSGGVRGNVFFSSRERGGGTSKLSGCGELLAFAELSGELDHNDDGKFLLSLRGTKFACEESCILRLTGFNETAADCFSAVCA